MAWVDTIDDTTPSDGALASEGDDRIRELKRAINERLAALINGWPNVDPQTLKAAKLDTGPSGMATVATGLDAAKPGVPATTFYWATDTNKLYFNEAGSWVEVGPSTSITNVSFTQMKGVRIQETVAIPAVPHDAEGTDQQGDAFIHILAPGSGILATTHVILGLKYRIRKTSVAWVNEYAQFSHRGSYNSGGGTPNWSNWYERAPDGVGGFLNLGVLLTRVRIIADGVTIEGRVINFTGAAADVEIGYDIYVLASA